MKFIVTINQKYETRIDVVVEAANEAEALGQARRFDDEKRYQSLWEATNARKEKSYNAHKGENP